MTEPRTLQTTAECIEALGGTGAVATLTRRSAQAVTNWRFRGVFPASLYLVMSEALRAAACRAPESLWGMVPARAAVRTAVRS